MKPQVVFLLIALALLWVVPASAQDWYRQDPQLRRMVIDSLGSNRESPYPGPDELLQPGLPRFKHPPIPSGAGNEFLAHFHRDGGGQPPQTAVLRTHANLQVDSVYEAWVARYNGLESSVDEALAIATDGSGNVYVAGYSTNSVTSTDYATIKYDPSGNEQWVARYNGPGNLSDYATALAFDGSGNVYVTGYSTGSGTSYDYATIKYDPSGSEQWVARFNGPHNANEYAHAVAVDGSGNVYVTGQSEELMGSDYATIKYDSFGSELWVKRYHSGAGSSDYATALAIDGSGNVYVTGIGWNLYTNYTTIKYSSNGVQLWVAQYEGTGGFHNDNAYAIAVDASGNVYVTGGSWGANAYDNDYATIKYNISGSQLWVARYNGTANSDDIATALALDGSGNVYVTGYSTGSGSSYDYATIKYDASGGEQWVAQYNGPGNAGDYAHDLVVDGSGNVYVTGRSSSGTSDDYATIKYDASGSEQWVARYNGPGNSSDNATALAIDGSGSVHVTGYSSGSGTSYDYATIKYDPSGSVQWVARYNTSGGATGSDDATALAVDGSGNIYVTGASNSGISNDYATIKYDASGAEQWVARYYGPSNSDDWATALAVDNSGNVYVAGYSTGSSGYYDYATIKYDASGNEQWVALYNGPGNSNDLPIALAVDNSGNVYVTGYSIGSGTSYDYATIKYDASGNEQWVARYDGPGDSDVARALAVDGSGNVYVTGTGSGTSYDYATIKYDASGSEQWVARYNGPGNSYDDAFALAVDESGNVFVTGYSVGSGTSDDYATIKYDPSGSEQWVARYNGPGNSHDNAYAVAVDGLGNVYVTGNSAGSGTSDDYATIKYDPSGSEQWVARYDGLGNSYDYAHDLVVDGSDNVYVAGLSVGSGTSEDYATIKYDPSGSEQWVAQYNGPGNSYDYSTALAVDGSGNVYVTGSSTGSGTSHDYATIKYQQMQSATQVSLLLPVSGAIVTTDSVVFIWRQSFPEVDRYWLEGATDSLFSTPFIDSLLTDTVRTVKFLQHDETYWWRVRAHNSYGWGPFSEVRSFFDFQEVPASPTLLLPPDSAIGISTFPTLSWNQSPGAEFYSLQVSDSPGFSMLVVDKDSLSETLLDITGLSNNTDYYWRVSASNALGTSDWSTVWNFRTVIALPGQITPVSPADGTIIVGDSASFLWHATHPEVDRYWFEYATDSSFKASTVDSMLTDTSAIVHDLHDHQTYYWRLRAHNAAGYGPFSGTWSLLVLTTPPKAPLLVSPSNNAMNQPKELSLSWRSVSSLLKQMASAEGIFRATHGDKPKTKKMDLRKGTASGGEPIQSQTILPDTIRYHAQLALDSAFSALVMNDSLLVDTTRQVGPLVNGTIYYWHVRASNVVGMSGWSETWSFRTIVELPSPVCLFLPPDRGVVTSDSVLFEWCQGRPEVDRYWHELATDSSFVNAVVDSSIIDTVTAVHQLQDNQTYWWKVRAHNAAGWGSFSEIRSFSVLVTSIANDKEMPFEFSLSQNYPNPFNPSTTIKYGLPKKAHVKLEIFNVLGQSVAVLADGEQEPGYHSVNFESSRLASGLYLYRLQAGDFVETKKFIVLR